MPYVIDGDGNCHVYVDADADLDMALDIVANAKMQRPSVCNAAETLLVHAAVADEFLPPRRGELLRRRRAARPATRPMQRSSSTCAWRCVSWTRSTTPSSTSPASGPATARRSSPVRLAAADRFTNEVDAAAVVVNASTRFVDGEEFGFGAEIGISTQKLHARGPMGLRELTTAKYVVRGDGQIRT